jgi:uncharacterized protein (UPF0210 family)
MGRECPSGDANFRFCGLAAAAPGIPYFPAAYGTREYAGTTSVGLQPSDALLAAIRNCSATPVPGHDQPEARQRYWDTAAAAMIRTLSGAAEPIAATVKAAAGEIASVHLSSRNNDRPCHSAAEFGFRFGGIDDSLAPHPTAASLPEVYAALGVSFGSPGTLSASAFLTRVLKAPLLGKDGQYVPSTGFCGLMLCPMEDVGMAEGNVQLQPITHEAPLSICILAECPAAGAKGAYALRDLLTLSSVCGVGLDTVPIPGKPAGLLSCYCQAAYIVIFLYWSQATPPWTQLPT